MKPPRIAAYPLLVADRSAINQLALTLADWAP